MAWDKTPSQKEAIKAFLVVDGNKTDLEASVAKFRTVCLQHIAGQTADAELLGSCLSALYDQYKGAYLNLDYIKSQVSQRVIKAHPELNEPSLFGNLAKRIETHLHENTGEGKTYSMVKSRGFCRTADQATKPTTAEAPKV